MIHGFVVTGVCVGCGATCQLTPTSYGKLITIRLTDGWRVVCQCQSDKGGDLLCPACASETNSKRIRA